MSKSHQKKHNQAVKTTHPQEKHKKQAAAPVKSQKKERGWILISAYIIIALHGILAAYLISTYPKPVLPVDKSYLLPILAANALLNVVAAIGMWYWKRWGLILYGISAMIAAAIGLVLTGQLLVIFYQLIPLAILGYILALKNKRQYFV
jgi:hypothetical protein